MRRSAGRPAHRLLLVLLLVGLALPGAVRVGHVQAPSSFASRVAQLSERGGYFDTDNLISNEKSYLHVIPALGDAGVKGGAYVGVGPDQNFSYIAQIRPSIAFIVDIRRDNLLLHLLFKGLFSLAETRADYLSLLCGRPPPAGPGGTAALEEWRRADLDRIVSYIDNTAPDAEATPALRSRVDGAIRASGVPLTAGDFATIDRFHRAFIARGLSLQFTSTGRTPRSYYPTYRELLLETDRRGRRWNFLASEDDFQFVRSLERRDLVIPVVGDLGGPAALAAIGRLMAERGERLSAFYTSNVEFYLFGDERFAKFVENLSHLPHASHSVIIRSVFGRLAPAQSAPGSYSASLVQRVDDLVQGYAEGRFRDYRELAGAR